MNRKIALDIETTGINMIDKPYIGHKIIEIGAIEIINRKITKNILHIYINPKRKIDDKAYKIHGISNEKLKNKPEFYEISEKIINFIKNSELIIHNANFDINFIEYELSLMNNKIKKINNICKITDTLSIARKIFPGKKNDLNSLCQRYKISTINRKKHGALIDSILLAKIFLNMTIKKNKILFSNKSLKKKNKIRKIKSKNIYIKKKINKSEKKKHLKYLNYMYKKYKKCIWINK